MSWDEFHRLPGRLGWKYEYYGGEAHLSPRQQSVACSVAAAPRQAAAPWIFLPVDREDDDLLVAAFVAAFTDTVEYCDWKREEIESSARECIAGYHSGRHGRPMPASCKAISRAGDKHEVLGLALVVAPEPGDAFLDLLLVIPSAQRQGLATGLVDTVLTELHAAGATGLRSRYMLANEASRAWHKVFGFVDDPDPQLARSMLDFYRHELDRRRQGGDLDEAERLRLEAESARWASELHLLESRSPHPDP